VKGGYNVSYKESLDNKMLDSKDIAYQRRDLKEQRNGGEEGG
jgi:hypothetical protein